MPVPDTPAEKRPVYWCVNYKQHNAFRMAQYMISCNCDATFEQFLQKVKQVTKDEDIMSFKYTLGNFKNVIIHSDESMQLAIKALDEKAFDIYQGGIVILVNQNNPMNQMYTALGLYLLLTQIIFIYWAYNLLRVREYEDYFNTAGEFVSRFPVY